MAFGSILDGPHMDVLTKLVEYALGSIIEAFSDQQVGLTLRTNCNSVVDKIFQ